MGCVTIPCTKYTQFSISGSGEVNALEGNKLIASYNALWMINTSISVDNPNVTASIVMVPDLSSGLFVEIHASTNYAETATIPWSETEVGSSSVNTTEGDKYITTSTLIAPNGDTVWSVTDDNADVITWMDNNELFANVTQTVPTQTSDVEVGGEVYPANRTMILIPIGILMVTLLSSAIIVFKRRNIRS